MLNAAFHKVYRHPLEDGHRFPMIKYELLAQELIKDNIVSEEDFIIPQPISDEIILLTHTAEYLQLLNECSLEPAMIRRIGFPLTPDLIYREKVIMQGTIECAKIAMKKGVALNIAGGTHHAFADKGEGFCLLNDLAITANYLHKFHGIKKILIVDLDVHQGNGTAKIFEGNHDIITFSMHGAANYPFQKEDSFLDIGLPDGTNDEQYLSTLSQHLYTLVLEHKPEFILYQCGVDILETDKIGRLKISKEGCRRRDELVFSICKTYGIPVAAAMGGGYSSKVKDVVEAHLNTFKEAQKIFF